jgi:hypothetical protein
MCGHRRGYGHFTFGYGRGRYKAEDVLERLEEHRRDLEQELADLSDLIRRLKEEKPELKTATV